MHPSRYTLLIAVIALLVGAGGSGRKVPSIGKAERCFLSRGFTVKEKPNLGAASVPAKTWFTATKGIVEIDVAYFDSPAKAEDARKHLVALTKRMAKKYGIKMTEQELSAVLRIRDSMLYWWPEPKPTYSRDVQTCLA